MILNILKFPDKNLRKKSSNVMEIDDEILKQLDNMTETMYHAQGLGLAGPQVGIHKRLIVMDVSTEDNPGKLLKLVNPEIINSEGLQSGEEGCLSLPGEYADVERAGYIKYRALNDKGETFEEEVYDLEARAIQHEIDHLDGKLFIDKLTPMKRDMMKKRIKKRIAQGDY